MTARRCLPGRCARFPPASPPAMSSSAVPRRAPRHPSHGCSTPVRVAPCCLPVSLNNRPDLEESICMRLPQGCGRLPRKIVRLVESLYVLKQASRQWHAHLFRCLMTLVFLQCLVDACIFCLMEGGSMVMTILVHLDDIYALGEKERCDQFGRGSNQRSRSRIW